jgi:MATE family multidrug resistance protein
MKAIVFTIVGANLLNAALDWVLVFGHLGFAAGGAGGSAVATTLSRWFMAVTMLAAGWSSLGPHLHPWRPGVFAFVPLRRMFLLGAPIGVQLQIEYGAFAFVGLLMGWLGAEQLAGHQVALNLASLTFMVPLGVSAAAAILIGNAIGRHDPAAARRYAGAALICGTGFMLLSALTFISIPRQLAELYTTQGGVLLLAMQLIPVAGIFQVFDGLQVVAGGILRGAGDTRIPMLINLLAYWIVMMPLCLFLGFRTSLGAVGLWYGLAAGLGAAALLLLGRIHHRFGKDLRRVILDEEHPQPTADSAL